MTKIGRYIFLALTSLLLVGIIVQVYLVGLTMLGGQSGVMDDHNGIGLVLGPVTLLIILPAYLGRLPNSMKLYSWLIFATYFAMLVLANVRQSVPSVAALHPVLALVLFAMTISQVISAWKAIREPLVATG
jgi:hypothetical protein